MELLDIVEVPLTTSQPYHHQQENYAFDASKAWARVGRATWKDIQGAVDAIAGPLWHNGNHTYHGKNDEVPYAIAQSLTYSLCLIRPDDLVIQTIDEQKYGGGGTQRRTRAVFSHNGHDYSLLFTDPAVSHAYGQEVGDHKIADALLCLSLAERMPGRDYAYKLAAALFTP